MRPAQSDAECRACDRETFLKITYRYHLSLVYTTPARESATAVYRRKQPQGIDRVAFELTHLARGEQAGSMGIGAGNQDAGRRARWGTLNFSQTK